MILSKKEISTKVKGSLFIKSFKHIDKKLLYAILLDVAFYLAVVGIIMLSFSLLKTNFMAVEQVLPTLGKIQGFSFEEPAMGQELESTAAMLRMTLLNGALILAGAAILVIIASGVLRSLLWSQILKKQIDKEYVKRFFLLKISWIPIWIAAIALLFTLFKPEVGRLVSAIMVLFYMHFTVILHSLFNKKERIWRMIKKAFVLGTKRFHKLIIPYILVVLVFFIVGLPGNLMIYLNARVFIIGGIYSVLFFVLAAWVRAYMSKTVKEIEKD
jgi:hypothetical protein